MSFIVIWQNATRTPGQKEAIEKAYHDRLAELCRTEENARRLAMQKSDPFSTWQMFNKVAHLEATRCLPPTERKQTRFVVRFDSTP